MNNNQGNNFIPRLISFFNNFLSNNQGNQIQFNQQNHKSNLNAMYSYSGQRTF